MQLLSPYYFIPYKTFALFIVYLYSFMTYWDDWIVWM